MAVICEVWFLVARNKRYKLAVSSLVAAVNIACTGCAYLRRDSQAELSWVAAPVPRRCTREVAQTVTHLSTNVG